MKTWHKHSVWIMFGMALLFIGAPALLLIRERQQEQRNRALIAAIKNSREEEALALLRSGVDADVLDRPPKIITLQSMLADFWQKMQGKASPKEEDASTPALL